MKTTFKTYNGLIRLYLRKKQALTDKVSEEQDLLKKEELEQDISRINNTLWSCFRKGEMQLKKLMVSLKNKYLFTELGDLYFNVNKTEDAIDHYKKALQLDNTFTTALNGMGNVYMNAGNYRQAIRFFRQSLQVDPDDLPIKTKLAEAYLKSGNVNQSRMLYEEVLERSPYHVDALIGLGECFTVLGERAMIEKEFDEVEGFFNKAQDLFKKSIKITEEWTSSPYAKASRRLNREETFKIKYSRAYLRVKMFEINKNNSDLNTALGWFGDIKSGNYMVSYKADNAFRKIQNVLKEKSGIKRKANSWVVFWLAVFVFLCSIFLYVVGKPDFHKKYFTVSSETLNGFLIQNGLDSVSQRFSGFTNKRFWSDNDLFNQLKKNLPAGTAEKNIKELIKPETQFGFNGFEPINELAFGSLLFGSLVFMVVGLYLRDLTKLKFGSIELEKTVIQTSSDSANLASKGGGLMIGSPSSR